ncbi:MAG: ADP-ribosylglycohydrolase family protein [Leptospiraceae bacterium]|nr:ADP-ribosylglycohydrolase family protein [Leptospiraceae bacterium]MCP5495924.1 ADP-ribosylglycohydrolase family protein [Leptospiraceae bacterium]
MKTNSTKNKQLIQSGIFGFCIGDALGVPVEFKSRNTIKKNPLTDMIGFGTHNQPPGTWSDDSSLALCLAESLTKGYDLQDIAKNFYKWYEEGYWGAHGEVFDIGGTTEEAILNIEEGCKAEEAGGTSEHDNGNGSLMRILPLVFYIDKKVTDEKEKYQIIKDVSSITHGHIRSVISCYIYIDLCLSIMKGLDFKQSYEQVVKEQEKYIAYMNGRDTQEFKRIFTGNIHDLKEEEIKSGGYVIHTLEASLWCLMNTKSYSEAVLKAVNLGDDTDTTGVVTGGLAGLYYGMEDIPKEWVEKMAKKDEIFDLCDRLFKSYYQDEGKSS